MIGAVGSYSSTMRYDAAGSARAVAKLSEDQLRQVDALKAADRKVRAHEQAHMAAGGGLVRGNSFEYAVGPDNRRYVVAGEVSIDASPGKTPEESIAKAQQVRAAALAPADPSAQDRRVAAEAAQMELQARSELLRQSGDQEGNSQVNSAIAAYNEIANQSPSSSGFAASA